MTHRCTRILALLSLCSTPPTALAAPPSGDRPEAAQGLGNRPERLERFRDLGFGLFIHWSVDSQIGSDINHTLGGGSDAHPHPVFDELPRTLKPPKIDPGGRGARGPLAGAEYLV